MKKAYRKEIGKRKRAIERRLKRRTYEAKDKPVVRGRNIHYEMAEKARGINYGGMGAMIEVAKAVGVMEEIDAKVHLLKRHSPYHESDHVMNIATNVLLGGKRLQDIELRRNDEVYLDAIDANRIPDPTTAGDFTRRFGQRDIEALMECFNRVRERVWEQQEEGFLAEAVIDIDGTLAGTLGECKGGMDISYKGIWGYAPLIVSLSNTREPLYVVNRSGNVASHEGAVKWIDRAIALVKPHAGRICLRGDTDFALTAHFDRWSESVDFVFGIDANQAMVSRAKALAERDFEVLERKAKYEVKTKERRRPTNVKAQRVRARKFKDVSVKREHVGEFTYRPTKCKQSYRVVVVRKTLRVRKGKQMLPDEVRYFFYITTRTDLSVAQVVRFANKRCDQENVIEQLKNGVNALRMPVNNLLSNWAYMVMASLAWSIKAWYALLMDEQQDKDEVLAMEFRRFLHTFILLPAQIIRTGRKIVYRLLGYNPWLPIFFATFERLKGLRLYPRSMGVT